MNLRFPFRHISVSLHYLYSKLIFFTSHCSSAVRDYWTFPCQVALTGCSTTFPFEDFLCALYYLWCCLIEISEMEKIKKSTWIKRWTICLRLYIILFFFQSFLYSYALCPGSPQMLLVYLSLSPIPGLASLLSLHTLSLNSQICFCLYAPSESKLLFILSHLFLVCYRYKFLKTELFVFKLLLNSTLTCSSKFRTWFGMTQVNTTAWRQAVLGFCAYFAVSWNEGGHKVPFNLNLAFIFCSGVLLLVIVYFFICCFLK